MLCSFDMIILEDIMNELEKAHAVISMKKVGDKELATIMNVTRESATSMRRNYFSGKGTLENTRWIKIHLLAEYYDSLDLENYVEPDEHYYAEKKYELETESDGVNIMVDGVHHFVNAGNQFGSFTIFFFDSIIEFKKLDLDNYVERDELKGISITIDGIDEKLKGRFQVFSKEPTVMDWFGTDTTIYGDIYLVKRH